MPQLAKTLNNLGICFILSFSSVGFAETHRSDLPKNEHIFQSKNILSFLSNKINNLNNIAPNLNLGGYDELVPFVLRSPNQEDAGSCLYMSLTGIAEWWLARLNPSLSRVPGGPLDLSERYLMNVAGIDEDNTKLPNWRTDSIFLFNQNGSKSVTNEAYRFTKGWYKGEAYSDEIIPAEPNSNNAEYGALFNWANQLSTISGGEVVLPKFEREVIFADPEANQWNIGIAPDDIVARVKNILVTRKAPVQVIYNQNSYWHSVYIIGFNDEQDNGNCAYTQSFRVRILDRVQELEKSASEATDPSVKAAYELRAAKAREAKTKIETAYATKGGCTASKGVFYIRDSIYPENEGPIYDYDLSQTGEEAPYAKTIVFKEYDWLRYFANHINLITAHE